MKGFSEQIIKGAVRDLHLSEPEVYVDNKKRDRSGHIGHAMVRTKNGRLLDFNANCSAYRECGHAAFGWVEYRISEDEGETFSEPIDFPYSVKLFQNGMQAVSVEKAVCATDGTIMAFCLINSQSRSICCEPWSAPMVAYSYDNGDTWSEVKPLCEHEGRIYDALEKDGVIYVLLHCNSARVNFCHYGNPYRIYKSEDNGQTFEEVSVIPFSEFEYFGYGNMIFTPEGKLIVYAYNAHDEYNMGCAISEDNGVTWEITNSHVANRIRNPQVNILDGQYILHGRASADYGFVMYTSKDGLNWDDGVVLDFSNCSCYYSNNIVLDNPKKPGKKRMLIQYSESYEHDDGRGWNAAVNIMHAWIESV